MFSIVECSSSDRSHWNAFVISASGTYCHLFGWKHVFERTYGLQTHYLACRSADAWLAVLPVAIMPHWPGRPVKAVSLPYCNFGGLLVAAGLEAGPLKSAFIAHLSGLGVSQVEFREMARGQAGASEVTMILHLPENSDLLWKQIGNKARNQVRKAQNSNLTLRWGRDQSDALYEIYAQNMGRLGTPVHSPKFLQEILASLGEQADVLTVRLEDRPVGAMLVVKHGKTWSDPMASCLTEFNALNPNMLLYWEALRAATEAGATAFDFGRSHKDSGTYRFKRQWGTEEVALNYHTYRHGALVQEAATTFYRGQGASRLAGAWQRLPAVVQRKLGPIVRRWVP
jgi:FemAB-related protein (PEP-CTERM system-associated)